MTTAGWPMNGRNYWRYLRLTVSGFDRDEKWVRRQLRRVFPRPPEEQYKPWVVTQEMDQTFRWKVDPWR